MKRDRRWPWCSSCWHCVPLLSSANIYINLASQMLIAAMFALSLNLLVGYGGLTSLGHAGFLGLVRLRLRWLR